MYRILFGPVLSRRLGLSLGVDLLPPKTCSLNCVYCECGRTTRLTLERQEYVPVSQVTEELARYLANHQRPDCVTFAGSGEPTLHSGLGACIAFLKEEYPDIRVTVLTNGTLLHLPEVRRDLRGADVVVPSLDAVSTAVFKAVNRPHPALDPAIMIEGLVAFRAEFPKELWLEIFVVPGLNTSPEEIDMLRAAVVRIKPDRIQLNALDRPGAETWVRAAAPEELRSFRDRLDLPGVEIIARPPSAATTGPEDEDPTTRILATVARRPSTVADLSAATGLPERAVIDILERLREKGTIAATTQERGIFFRLSEPPGAASGA